MATLDQVLAVVNTVSAKLSTVIQELGVLMTQQDDTNAALAGYTATLNAVADELNATHAELVDLLAQLRAQVAAGQVTPATMAALDAAVARVKPAADQMEAALAPDQPPPAPAPGA